eukprot:UN00481
MHQKVVMVLIKDVNHVKIIVNHVNHVKIIVNHVNITVNNNHVVNVKVVVVIKVINLHVINHIKDKHHKMLVKMAKQNNKNKLHHVLHLILKNNHNNLNNNNNHNKHQHVVLISSYLNLHNKQLVAHNVNILVKIVVKGSSYNNNNSFRSGGGNNGGSSGGKLRRHNFFNDVSDPVKERELFGELRTGIDFSMYDSIQGTATGPDPSVKVPATISSFSEISFGPHVEANLKLCGYERPTPIQKYSLPISNE